MDVKYQAGKNEIRGLKKCHALKIETCHSLKCLMNKVFYHEPTTTQHTHPHKGESTHKSMHMYLCTHTYTNARGQTYAYIPFPLTNAHRHIHKRIYTRARERAQTH